EPPLAGALALARRAAAEGRPLRIASDLSERIRDVSPELFAAFRRRLEPKARGQLAPWRIVDSIEAACTLPKEAAFAREREYFIECRDSPQRQALVHVFFAERAVALIQGWTGYQALGTADIVIEAVFEDLKVKQQVFARLDQEAAPHAILATNTSTLDIDAIAASTSRPERVVGTHFFSPAN